MKCLRFCLLAVFGLSVFAGCGEIKRKAEEVTNAAERRAIDKAAEKGHDATSDAIDSAADPGAKKKDSEDAKNRNALKGSKDDPDN